MGGVRHVMLRGFGGYRKDSTCKSSVVFTLDVFYFGFEVKIELFLISLYILLGYFCFCGILTSPSAVSQRGGSTSAAQVSSNGLVVRS